MNKFQKEITEKLDQCFLFQRGDFRVWKTWEKQYNQVQNIQFKIKGTTFIALVTEDKLLFYDLDDLMRAPYPSKKAHFAWKDKVNYIEKDKKGNIIWPIFKDFEDVFDEVDSEVVEDIMLNMDAFINISE